MVIKSMQLVSVISHRPCPGRRMRRSCVCHRLMYLHINNYPLVLAVYQLPAANHALQLDMSVERIQLPTPSFLLLLLRNMLFHHIPSQ